MDPAVMFFAYYINSSTITLIANWINSVIRCVAFERNRFS